MARICLDHDVSRDAAKLLAEDGHEASTAWDEGLARATDDEHLLLAARHGQIFVTHNHGDFFLLHDAWRRWSAAWQVDVRHAGILVIPQWPAGRIAREVDAFLRQGLPLSNELYHWKPSVGWARRP